MDVRSKVVQCGFSCRPFYPILRSRSHFDNSEVQKSAKVQAATPFPSLNRQIADKVKRGTITRTSCQPERILFEHLNLSQQKVLWSEPFWLRKV
jgi:hypothetical protein